MVMGDDGVTALVMVGVGCGGSMVDGGKVYYLFLRRATYCGDFSDAAQEPTYPQSC